jgi:peptide/nickel transport system substrate-binding protein
MKGRLAPFAAATATAIAVGLVLLSVASAAPSSRDAASATQMPLLRIGTSFNYGTLDPAYTNGCNTVTCRTIFNKLMKITPDGKVVGSLAKSVARPSAATYVFTLRRGIKFWDGNEMTAADVENALNYQRFPKFNSAPGLSKIKSVKAKGRYTVAVVLKHPDAGFPYTLALQGPIFEKKFQEDHQTTMGRPGVLLQGTGPWMVDSFNPTTGLELSANPHYWDGPVNFKHVTAKFFTDETSLALAMRAGDIDVTFPSNSRSFSATAGGGVRIIDIPSHFLVGFFAMNWKVAPFDDVHVRRAVAYAINRAELLGPRGPGTTPVSTLVPPDSLKPLASAAKVNALLRSIETYPYNLDKAKAEMAKSAHPNGFTVSSPTYNSGANLDVLQAIAGNLAKIGIKLDLDVMTPSAWIAKIFGPKTYSNVYTDAGWTSPDPGGYPSFFIAANKGQPTQLNIANYTPPKAIGLVAAAAAAQNPVRRLGLYGQLLKELATDVPYVPLYTAGFPMALSNKFVWTGQTSNNYFNTGLYPLLIKAAN